MSFDFEILDKAGVTQGEFAKLTGAARGTVNNWVRGKSIPTRAYHKAVAKHLKVINAAFETGKLPGDLPRVYRMNVESRMRYIHDTLSDTVTELRSKE